MRLPKTKHPNNRHQRPRRNSLQQDATLLRYQQLRLEKPAHFENPVGCPTQILFGDREIKEAQQEAHIERQRLGWPTNDLRVGVLAEDPYIGYVVRDAVRFADGRLGLYNRVLAPGGLVVLPIFDDSIALIRIFRHGARRWFLEAPQGALTGNGDIADAARQELREEIAAEAHDLIPLGSLYTSTGLTSERLELFAAKISAYGKPQSAEGIESVERIRGDDIDSRILGGSICDGPTVSLIFRARLHGLI